MAFFTQISPGVIIKQEQGFTSSGIVGANGGGAALTPQVSLDLSDGIITPTPILTYDSALVQFLTIRGSISRGSFFSKVEIMVSHDGTTTSCVATSVAVASPGITFTAGLSGSDLVIYYTSTPIGTDAVFQYNDSEKWA